jgi:hypothetical protein
MGECPSKGKDEDVDGDRIDDEGVGDGGASPSL